MMSLRWWAHVGMHETPRMRYRPGGYSRPIVVEFFADGGGFTESVAKAGRDLRSFGIDIR